MKVIFTDGTFGDLSKGESKNLYIKNRFTLEAWQDLKNEMDQLAIITYEDPYLVEINIMLQKVNSGCDTFVSIEYVRNQITAHLI